MRVAEPDTMMVDMPPRCTANPGLYCWRRANGFGLHHGLASRLLVQPSQDERPVRILLIDDDSEMLAMLRDALTRLRMDVIAQSSGPDALVALEMVRVDAVVVDKEMPGMSGFEVLQALRRGHPELPVIVITAFGGRGTADDALHRGASGYLEKPFRIHDLVAMLHGVGAN